MSKKSKEVIPPYPPLKGGGRGTSLLKKSRDNYAPVKHQKEKIPSHVKEALQSEDETNETKFRRNVVVLGIGNVLLSDEGAGVHVANELAKMDLPCNVSVVEGGTDGFRLLNIITEADRLIVVDAVRGGAGPGSIYRFDVEDVRTCPAGFRTSVHQIGILEVIDLSGLIGKTPHTTVIGIEPKSLEMSMELSPVVKEKIPRVIELVMDEIRLFLNKHCC
jgi:hydrogenase maturation protease